MGEQFQHKDQDLLKQKVLLITCFTDISYSSTLSFEVKFWIYQVGQGFYISRTMKSLVYYIKVRLYKSDKTVSVITVSEDLGCITSLKCTVGPHKDLIYTVLFRHLQN